MPRRTFAIGDIHGCDEALDCLLTDIDPTEEDTFIILGDVIDRGPNSRRTIELLLGLKRISNLILIMGNHEEMLFEALQRGPRGLKTSRWMQHGGIPMLASYGGQVEDIPTFHLDFLADGLPYYETETDIFVHANLDEDLPLEQQSIDSLRWRHLSGDEQPHCSGKRVICGHTPMHSGIPQVFDGWVGIDTFAYGGMFLTAINIDTDEIHQANQRGYTRSGVTLAELM